jgi:heat shock protein HspQ
MDWDNEDTRAYVSELQFLQRQINLLQRANATSPEPTLEDTIDSLRNSQTKLYSALSQHGVTAEDVYKVIMENSDKALIAEILNLQKNKDSLSKKLANPAISPKSRQTLEFSLDQTSQQYKELWGEMVNSPNREELMNRLEAAMTKRLQKNRSRDKTRDQDKTR